MFWELSHEWQPTKRLAHSIEELEQLPPFRHAAIIGFEHEPDIDVHYNGYGHIHLDQWMCTTYCTCLSLNERAGDGTTYGKDRWCMTWVRVHELQ